MSEETQEVTEETTTQESNQTESLGISQDDLNRLISDAVEKEVQGLKSNNKALKEEKKKFQEKAKEASSWVEELGGNEEIERLRKIKTQIDQDEEMRLFTEGDREKYNDRITSRVKADAEAKIQALIDENNSLKSTTQDAIEKYQFREIENSIQSACSKGSVKAHLFDAVKGQIRNQIKYDNETDTLVVYDNEGIRYGADGNPMKVEELVETLRDTQPELFQPSSGSGALGGGITSRIGRITNDQIKSMSVEDYKKAKSDGRL